MKYTSTQNEKRSDSFEQALFSPGYLPDGGLYMPEKVPKVSKDTLECWSQLSFPDLCKEVLSLYISEEEIPRKDLNDLIERAYSNFTSQDKIGRLVQLSNGLNILELFHGKTLAFKDVSMCVVGQLINYYLEKRRKHVIVVVGTSGDTGSAAIEAVRGLRWVDIVVLLPHGRCTQLQELMMTTVIEDNVHVFAVDGTSDDLDGPIKAVSIDKGFRDQHYLMTMNSINMSRVVVQIVLYFWAYFRGRKSSEGQVEVVVPTGAGGSITGGCLARHMGLPIKLVCAVNTNDIVHRIIKDGDYSVADDVVPTYATAMDIQVPYNMERLFWLMSGGDSEAVKEIMNQHDNTGKATLPKKIHTKMQSVFSSFTCNEERLLSAMRRCWQENQYLVCPHTAVAVAYCYDKLDRAQEEANTTNLNEASNATTSSVCIATASPAKFPEAAVAAGVPISTTPAIKKLPSLPTQSTPMEKGQDWEAMLRDKITEISAGHDLNNFSVFGDNFGDTRHGLLLMLQDLLYPIPGARNFKKLTLTSAMKYTSTQNEKRSDSFEQALFSPGFLSDGGLYVPALIPKVSKDTLECWSQLSFPDLCKEVLSLYISEEEIPRKDLNDLIERAYSNFTSQDKIGPLIQLSNGLNILELFHGKTLAFKDVSLCVVGQLINYYLEKRRKHVTIVVGTSGDTGSAAIEAVHGLRWVDIVVLLPHGRCTQLQELMMTTVIEDNVHVFAADGASGDFSSVIKAVSRDTDFRDQHHLMTMNSTNISRVLVQSVLYFWAYFRGRKSSEGHVEVVVPTGGGGSVTGGCLARHMGLPIKLACAVNSNNIVHRLIKDGDYSVVGDVVPTYATAMDIKVPYNMERLFWMISGGDTEAVKEIMNQHYNTRKATIPEKIHTKMRSIFSSFTCNEECLLSAMRRCWQENQYLVCPHTAVAVAYYYDKLDRTQEEANTANLNKASCATTLSVCIATASPAKFPEAAVAAGVPISTTPTIKKLPSLPTQSTPMEKGQDWEAMLRDKIKEISAGHDLSN